MKKVIILIICLFCLFFISCNSRDVKTDSSSKNNTDTEVEDNTKEKTLEKVELASVGKIVYELNEEFDPTGFSLKITYSDDSVNTINVARDMVTIDLKEIGSFTAKITYKEGDIEKSVSFNYTVKGIEPIELVCLKTGDTIYWAEKKLDLSKFEFAIKYSDGTFLTIKNDEVKTNFDQFTENDTDEGIVEKITVFTTFEGKTYNCIIEVINYSEWIYEEKITEENDKYITEYVRMLAEIPEQVNHGDVLNFFTSSDLPINNYIVVWQSSNTQLIDSSGVVEADEKDKSLTITLKIKRGTTQVCEYTYDVKVVGLGPVVFPTFDRSEKQVFAYSYEGTFVSLDNVNARKINFYNYCFANISSDHELTLAGLGHLKEVLSYRRKYGIRVILSIKNGPWAETIKNDAYFEKFLASIINVIDEYHFDGIDMDWEFPQKNTEVSLFTKLIQGTREALDTYKEGLFLTCALIGGGSVTNVKEYYDCPAIKDYIDYAHLMTYDLNISSLASHHTNPLAGRPYSAEGSISFYSGAGMPYEKIVIGAAFYGKISELSSPYDSATERVLNKAVSSTNTVKYSTIKRTYLSDPNYVKYYDSSCGAYYLTNGRYFITFDTPDSIVTKGQLIKKYNLGGMMFWDLGSDDTFELLSAVYGVVCDINTGRL